MKGEGLYVRAYSEKTREYDWGVKMGSALGQLVESVILTEVPHKKVTLCEPRNWIFKSSLLIKELSASYNPVVKSCRE